MGNHDLSIFSLRKNRITFQKNLLKGLRNGLGFIIIIFSLIYLPLFGPHPVLVYVSCPLIFVLQIMGSNLILKKKYEGFCSHYLTMKLSIMIHVSLEVIFVIDKSDFKGVILGMELLTIFSIFLVSKIPVIHLLFSSTLLNIHLLMRLDWNDINGFLTLVVYYVLSYYLVALYSNHDTLNKKIWKELERSHKNVLRFRNIIQMFPNPIIIIGKESLALDTALYQNEEAKKFFSQAKLSKVLNSINFEEFIESSATKPQPKWRTFREALDCKLKQEDSTEDFVDLIANFKKEILTDDKSLLENHQDDIQIEEEYAQGMNKFVSTKIDAEINPLLIPMRKDENADSSKTSIPDRTIESKLEIKMAKIEWGQGNESAVIVIFNDISKSEKIRELRTLHKNKDNLLASVSHELRTPLNGIIGMLEISEEKAADPKVRKYLTTAKNWARMLLLMINDILDTYQIQQGKFRLNMESVNLNALMEDVIPLMKVQIKKKGISLIYQNLCPNPTFVHADRIRLQQILLNLLSNACKFTERGTISIEAALKTESLQVSDFEEPDGRAQEVVISVKDTGRGIKQEKIDQLFTLFGKFENSGNETGVGLGLAISQRLSMSMNSKGIQVESEVGKGSRFQITLNINEDMNSEEIFFRNPVKTKSIKGFNSFMRVNKKHSKLSSCRRILVVDDDQVNHMVISKYISDLGLSILIEKVFNGEEAVEIVKRRADGGCFFDVILMDCNMPVLDGFEATRLIRRYLNETTNPQPVIMAITANASINDKQIFIACGMNDALQKPLIKKDFQEKLRQTLNDIKV